MSRTRALTALVVFLVVVAWGCCGRARPTPETAPDVRNEGGPERGALGPVAEACNRFACDLYKELSGYEGNLFFSPYSISAALSMTYAGAEGLTEKELARVLHVSTEEGQWHRAVGELQRTLNQGAAEESYELHVANGLWAQQDYELLGYFVSVTRDHYGAAVAGMDFRRAPDEARVTINGWVREQTQDRIRDLLAPGTVDDSTRLVLTNAIYFKGMWMRQFDPKSTRDEPFWVAPDEAVSVPMMHQRGEFAFAEFESLKLLVMPYAGADLSTVVVLPHEVGGLPELETRLSAESLRAWLGALHEVEVRVAIPRFTMTSMFELNGPLSELGMPSAFNARSADFSGMTGKRDLFVSAALHKAYVDFNEEGTEAAAATGVVMGLTAARPGPIFVADHPFLFLIRHNPTGCILFAGRVLNPLA